MSRDDAIDRAVRDVLSRPRRRTPEKPWGEDGWLWERVAFESMSGDPAAMEMSAKFMSTPAACGGNSRQGGLAMKLEVWRNAHWFVNLHRDEIVMAMGKGNMGSATQPDFEFPKMIWLSMRRTDRSDATFHDWREMQRVKNDLVGPEHEACELYPAESRLVDSADQFHLWVFEESTRTCFFPFGYMQRDVRDASDPDSATGSGGTQRAFDTIPQWRECPAGCKQGMVLEVDPYDPTGETEGLPKVPARRYRCQDCNEELPVE